MSLVVALLAAAFIVLGPIFVGDILTFDRSDDQALKQGGPTQEQTIGQ